MFREVIARRLLTVAIWLLVVNLGRLAAGGWDWNWLFFWLGAIVSIFLVDFDAWLDQLVFNPQAEVSQQIKSFWQARQYRQAYNWLLDSEQRAVKLVFRGILFQFVLVVFCFWALTSTGNWLGKGVVMALFLQLAVESIRLILQNQNHRLRQRLFGIFKKSPSAKAEVLWVIGFVLAFLTLNLLLL